jgi:hypothetical protein
MQNAQIRDRVNRFLGGLAKPTVAHRKAALRASAMGSADDFNLFLAAIKKTPAIMIRTLMHWATTESKRSLRRALRV